MTAFENDVFFRKCMGISLALHAGLWLVINSTPAPPARFPDLPVVIDLTRPILGGAPAKLGAPKRLVPEAKGPALPAEEPVPEDIKPAEEAPKDWVLKGPETKTIEEAPEPVATPGGAEGGTGTAAKTGGWGVGADDGVPGGTGTGGTGLVSYPKLINRAEVFGLLRRYYPRRERDAGNSGRVIIAVTISSDGTVEPQEVIKSAGPHFDGAARKIVTLMRFEPAMGPQGPVAVKIPQALTFQIQR